MLSIICLENSFVCAETILSKAKTGWHFRWALVPLPGNAVWWPWCRHFRTFDHSRGRWDRRGEIKMTQENLHRRANLLPQRFQVHGIRGGSPGRPTDWRLQGQPLAACRTQCPGEWKWKRWEELPSSGPASFLGLSSVPLDTTQQVHAILCTWILLLSKASHWKIIIVHIRCKCCKCQGLDQALAED